MVRVVNFPNFCSVPKETDRSVHFLKTNTNDANFVVRKMASLDVFLMNI